MAGKAEREQSVDTREDTERIERETVGEGVHGAFRAMLDRLETVAF